MDETEEHLKWSLAGWEGQKLSYVEYRPNTNSATLWKTGHAKGGYIWVGEVKRRKLRRWIWGWFTLYRRMNTGFLNWLKPP
jgi:membrane-associated PAP2 superfamily phosphatase